MKKHCLFFLFTLLHLLVFSQRPAANFSARQVSGCAPLVVNFQDLSLGRPTSWNWNFGNGSTSTLQNPSTVYFTPGTYAVSLVATNNSGSDTVARSAYITVYDKPQIRFNAGGTSGCYPFAVSFTDASVASAGTRNVNWQWDFGNGIQSSQQTSLVTYRTAGNYTVSLTVTNDKGCAATLSKPAYIRVAGGLSLGFDNSSVNRCQAPFPISFINRSSGPGTLNYVWNFGDGTTSTQQNPVHSYGAAGNYPVMLVVSSSNGCTDTLRKKDSVIIPKIQSGFSSPDSICAFGTAYYANTSKPLPNAARWTFGDGAVSHALVNTARQYNIPGAYTVTLFNTYSYCTDTVTRNLSVIAKPNPDFSATGSGQCKAPAIVTFTSAATDAVSWQWDFGDGQTSTQQNPVHTFRAEGSYNVSLTVKNAFGCTNVLQKPAFIQIRKPTISFPSLPQNGCLPYTANFSASIDAPDSVRSYLWDFGDGTTSTEAMPTHIYSTQGSYNISLTITTNLGCADTLLLEKAVSVGRKPTAGFSAAPNPVCAYQNVSFNAAANEGDQWEWNFGDKSGATGPNPVHAYKDTGRFTVQLIVSNSGCRDTLKKRRLITVKPPVARFFIKKNCPLSREMQFIDSSLGATTWFWNFDDSSTSTEQSPVHTFNKDGTYNVSLTVTNGACSHTFTSQVFIFKARPSFTADVREACKTATVNYRAVLEKPEQILAYNWLSSNGDTATGNKVQLTYPDAGNFSTTLITTDIYGCKDSVTEINYIRINGPTAKFTAFNSTGCKGLNVAFTDTSATDGVHNITEWKWVYGDGQSATFSSRVPFSHTYVDTGSFTVQLTVTDAAGCKDSVAIDSLVRTKAPAVKFASADTLTCLGSTVSFTNQTDPKNYVSEWSFGDSTISTTDNPTHVYANEGSYTVTLKITDSSGCSNSLTLPAFINIRKTSASFRASDTLGGCLPFKVQFTNTSDFYESTVWSFGGDSSTVTSPSYTFAVAGTYPVTLLVTGRGGCIDSAKSNITVYSDTAIKFSYTPLEGCRPVLVSASVNSPVDMTYSWDFGDGALVTTKDKNITHQFTGIGDYVPRLIVTDSGNCLIPLFGVDPIHVKGVITKFGWDKKLLCDSGTVAFLDSTRYNEPTTYHWTFGDGSSSSATSPVHFYQQPGLYTVSLAAQTASNCTDTTTYQALVKVVQSPSISVLGDSVFCQNDIALHSGHYLRSDTSAVQWFWEFPNGNTATAVQPPAQQYSTEGDFVIKAIAVNSSGCADSAFKKIRIHPVPSVTLPQQLTTPVGTPVLIQPAIYSADVIRYMWTPANGLSCTDCPQPVATPLTNTIYTVVTSNADNCEATAQVRITIFCEEANVFVPNTFSPNGDGSNDVFYVRGRGLPRVKSLRIFNRLGEVVFERINFSVNDSSSGWDGTYKGKKLAPDTYIYQLEVFCGSNTLVKRDGSITLIR